MYFLCSHKDPLKDQGHQGPRDGYEYSCGWALYSQEVCFHFRDAVAEQKGMRRNECMILTKNGMRPILRSSCIGEKHNFIFYSSNTGRISAYDSHRMLSAEWILSERDSHQSPVPSFWPNWSFRPFPHKSGPSNKMQVVIGSGNQQMLFAFSPVWSSTRLILTAEHPLPQTGIYSSTRWWPHV